MNFGSLFAGIGGIDLGLERAGMSCAWQVEIDDYATKILQKHWPDVIRFRDVRDCGKHNLEPVDLICRGFPCQDVSLAGNRAGLKGKRSTLWSEFYRIICEIRPRWILAENVPGLLSSDDGRFFATILRDLAQSGYDAEWDIVPANAVHAAHRRERVFIIAYPKSCYASRTKKRQDSGKPYSSRIWTGLRHQPRGFSTVRPLERWEHRTGLPITSIHRTIDGISRELDKVRRSRLKCLGNAVVPQVAEWIGQQIIQAEQLSF